MAPSLFRPRTNQTCHKMPNPSRQTVPLKSLNLDKLTKNQSNRTQIKLSRQRLFSKLSSKNYFGVCSFNAEIFTTNEIGPTSRKNPPTLKMEITKKTFPVCLFCSHCGCSLWQLHAAQSFILSTYTVKKVNDFPVPSRDVTNLFYSAYLSLCDICYPLRLNVY